MGYKVSETISAIDTVSEMLIVAAMTNPAVRKAMGLISQASFDLGELQFAMVEGGEKD
ncbi:MAG TPA: hypothetical protein GX523_15305 [Desulfitobacterium dehalogenans]|uniref:Uncharacterized protein n=1 Tax=Desulfitobacterium dehalogenans TaxID=36854 RepID=A0A7C6Z6C5_9FIRM|nr:hypothetical protein [Desulfitobacterium dehalogenans]